MKISLIGMSGSGKTYWSKKMEKKGFIRFCCDDLIENKLHEELKSLGYKGGIKDLAKWMGQPYEKKYRITSKKYVSIEKQVMKEVLNTVEKQFDKNLIIDTTGSVIYTGNRILERLKNLTKVIFL